MVILVVNLSGTSAAATAYTQDILKHCGANISVIGETKFTSAMAVEDFRATIGGRIIAVRVR
jgi:hypothetical protein